MPYAEEDYLQLSGIQHFSFCRRQWALIHIEHQWDENYLTAHGRVTHERVHSKDCCDMRGGILTIRGLDIHSAELGAVGTCDAVEFKPAEDGITLSGRKGKWSLCPVEYKRGRTKANDCDRLQVCAQAMCLEEMFCCEIDTAYLFYFETRRREKVELTQDLRREVCGMFREMHGYFSRGHTPTVRPSKSCEACSLSDVCLPLLNKKSGQSVRDYISEYVGTEKL